MAPPIRRIKADLPSREELASITARINQQKEDERLANTSPQNLKHRARVKRADEKTRQTAPSGQNIMEHIITPISNLYMPSQWVGAAIDAAKGKRGFWESLGKGNSGFVSDKFAEEHPYWSMGINMLGDSGAYGSKAIVNGVKPSIQKRIVSRQLNKDIKNTKLPNQAIADPSKSIYVFRRVNPNEPKTKYLFQERPSKLSQAEKSGIPKGERNQPLSEGYGDHNLSLNYIPNSLPVDAPDRVGPAIYEFHHRMLGINPSKDFQANLKQYVQNLPEAPNVDRLTIQDYRRYLNNLKVSSRDLSDNDIAKLINDQYLTLQKGQTGKLKGTVLYHGSPDMFDVFDFTNTSKYTGNSGAVGPANYFSTGRTQYGLTGEYGRLRGNMQPYLVTDIQSTPNKMTLLKKGLIPEYNSHPTEEDISNMINNWRLNRNAFILDEGSTVMPNTVQPTINGSMSNPTSSFKIRSFEGALHRNTGIKSLFPHPSTLQKNSNGKWFINRDWNDPRVNYGYSSTNIPGENAAFMEDYLNRLRAQGHNTDDLKLPEVRLIDPKNDLYDKLSVNRNAGAWYHPSVNQVTLRSNNPDYGLWNHEYLGHGLRYSLSNSSNPKWPVSRGVLNRGVELEQQTGMNVHIPVNAAQFNQNEINVLSDAYPWVKDFPSLNNNTQKILNERGAVNTQFRAKISQNNNHATGKQLDRVIDNTDDGTILRMLQEQPYTSSISEDIARITNVDIDDIVWLTPKELNQLANKYPKLKEIVSKVKNSMKTVAVTTGAVSTVGLSANSKYKQGGKIRRFQNSGKIDWNQVGEYAKIGASFLPIIGSGMDIYEAYKNPTWSNIGMAALSVGTDLAGIGLLRGSLRAIRAAKKARAAYDAGIKYVQATKRNISNLQKAKNNISSLPNSMQQTYTDLIDDALKQANSQYKRAEFNLKGLSRTVAQKDHKERFLQSVDKKLPWIIYVKGPDIFANALQQFSKNKEYKNGGKVGDQTKGRFTFKKTKMVKDAEEINGKRDMRKKLVKSDVVTNKRKRIQKGQQGMKFVSYKPVQTPIYKPEEMSPFSEYNYPSTYQQYIVQPEAPQEQPSFELFTEPVVKEEVLKPKKPTPKKAPYKGKNQWSKDMADAYRRAGITNENAIRMLIAQDAQESGWGKSVYGNFNYGNLTTGSSWKGKSVRGKDSDGKGNTIYNNFRSYDSIDEYAKDKIDFLTRLYDFNQDDDIHTFANKLQGGNRKKRRYAGDPNYVKSLTRIYNGL